MPSPSYPFLLVLLIIGVSFGILLLLFPLLLIVSPFPLSLLLLLPLEVPAWTFDDLLDVFIATRFIEFFSVIASGGESDVNCWFVELSDDNDDDDSERSEVEPPLWINSVWFLSLSDVL